MVQLGELERNRRYFDERQVTLVGVSVDTVEQSQAMAKRLGLTFAVASDDKRALSAALVGVDDAEVSIPGVVLVENSKVVFRQVAKSKDDRISTSDLLAAIDRNMSAPAAAPTSAVVIDRSFGPLRRLAVGVHVAGGATTGPEFAGHAAVFAEYPLHRRFSLGPHIGGWHANGNRAVDFGGRLTFRQPFWNDLASLDISGGAARSVSISGEANALSLRASATVWFALRPQWAIESGLQFHHNGDKNDVTFAVGFRRLIALGE